MTRPLGEYIDTIATRANKPLASIRRYACTTRYAQVCMFLCLALILFYTYKHTETQRIYGLAQIDSSTEASSNVPAPPKDENEALLELAPYYIKAIMDTKNPSFPECPSIVPNRYTHLRKASTKYYFALDLHQNAAIIPRLVSSIVETIKFLGPQKCTLSVVEGGSTDGTYEIMSLLRKRIEKIGATYHFVSSDLDPRVGERIETLAKLRNLALEPLVRSHQLEDTTVIFLNDVGVCAEDILELVYQQMYQDADMTCAMDWTYVGKDPTFYDVWIARGMNGDSFFEIPPDGNWNSSWNLFWNNDESRDKLNNHQPFQVFSCWNGAVVFPAEMLDKVAFRSSREGECHQGEPKLLCKDMWHAGYGKIAVIPSVSLAYDNESTKKIKELKGYTSIWATTEDEKIDWDPDPPELVKCMINYENQMFVPWNETLS